MLNDIANKRIAGVQRMTRLVAVTGLLSAVAGCDGLLLDVRDRELFEPLPVYREWWEQLQRCTGLTGPFDTIEWWTGEAIAVDGRDKVGLWLAPNTIILESFYVTSEPAVKHEMLHHLTNGEMPHSAPEFTRCTTPRRARGTIPFGPRPRR